MEKIRQEVIDDLFDWEYDSISCCLKDIVLHGGNFAGLCNLSDNELVEELVRIYDEDPEYELITRFKIAISANKLITGVK